MPVRYQFRFYPTESQELALSKVFGCCRYVYNRALEYRSKAWEDAKERISYGDTSALLPIWKREEGTEWLAQVSSVPLQQSLRHLNEAYTKFFNKEAKYPKFKAKRHKQSATYTLSAFKFSRPDPENPNLKVTGLGRLRVRWSRAFSSNPKTLTIIKKPSGRYYVSLTLEESFPKLEPTGKSVGIDFGIDRLATTSDGQSIDNQRQTEKNQLRLALAQRTLSRRKKGSGRWHRQRIRVARIQEHIGNARKDYLDKVTTDLVRRYDSISIEDLNVKGMIEKSLFAKSVTDASFGIMRKMLEYKSQRYGRELKVIDRYYPSSKRCSQCDYTLASLPLNQRSWVCPECKTIHDRDENAAKTIHKAGGHPVTARGGKVRRFKPLGLNRSSRRSVNHLEVIP